SPQSKVCAGTQQREGGPVGGSRMTESEPGGQPGCVLNIGSGTWNCAQSTWICTAIGGSPCVAPEGEGYHPDRDRCCTPEDGPLLPRRPLPLTARRTVVEGSDRLEPGTPRLQENNSR